MKHPIALITLSLFIVFARLWFAIDAVEARSSDAITQQVHLKPCFRGNELSWSLGTLKQYERGAEVTKVYESLLTRARFSSGCRTEVIDAVIKSLEQVSTDTTDQNEKFLFWQHGAGLLGELKATEALDLLIANIDLTDGWSASITEYHVPALAAILRIGVPAIPKLEIALRNDAVPYRRKLAALCIASIGGGHARRALTSALPGESDPCVKRFLQLSLQAFDNRAKPNHISSELNGKWFSAFYCL
jgi:hypothetical protein